MHAELIAHVALQGKVLGVASPICKRATRLSPFNTWQSPQQKAPEKGWYRLMIEVAVGFRWTRERLVMTISRQHIE